MDSSAEANAERAVRQLQRGEPLLAYNDTQVGLALAPGHVRLRQLQALALARAADVDRANALFRELADEGHIDSETLGMLARTHKDLALAAQAGAEREHHLKESLRIYSASFDSMRHAGRIADATYTGINAAAMAVLAGDLALAHRLARQVRALAGDARETSDDYWREATLGEAALILGESDEARARYARAAQLAGGRHGDLNSTRRQARVLAAHLPGDRGAYAQALKVPPVLIFTGHMMDAPGRDTARFPASREEEIRAELQRRFESRRPMAVYASAACGADILCLETVRQSGGETHIVLPFPEAEFYRSSVEFAGGDWGERFHRELAAARSVTVASDHRASGSTAAFAYANLILTGMGRLRASVLDTDIWALAVLDPSQAALEGGTASLVSQWQSFGLEVDFIRIDEAGADAPDSNPNPNPNSKSNSALTNSTTRASGHHELRALLFADAVGYSQLSEDQIPGFISGFLGSVAALNARTAHRFEHVETSGDGLYMVFRDVHDAGHYALELGALSRDLDRAAWGLPETFGLRIALHCGPVHCARDPITGGNLYTGPHTSRAARIEPVTPPGHVYVSSAFAAVAAARGAAGWRLGYVGQTPLAKGHGTIGLYSLRLA